MNIDSTQTIDALFKGRLGNFLFSISIRVPGCGVTSIFGPSGSGKTTILRCIAGLERLPGKLVFLGQVWQDSSSKVFLPPERRKIGYVFQDAQLFSHLTVKQNLLYGIRRALGKNRGRPFDSVNRLVKDDKVIFNFEAAVELLKIGALLNRSPSHLSGGEIQRVALGRALLSQPQLLLLDEPVSALDDEIRQEILVYLKSVSIHAKIPILYVSHDVNEVSKLAEHIVMVSQGTNIASGPIGQVFEKFESYASEGRIELGAVIKAEVVDHDYDFNLSTLKIGDQYLTVPLLNMPNGHMCQIRIRARDVALATKRPENISIRNVLTGEIVKVHYQENAAHVEILIDVGRVRIISRITRKSVKELSILTGQSIFVLIKSVSVE